MDKKFFSLMAHILSWKEKCNSLKSLSKFGCGVPCAYMISKEKTSTVYKLFIETINNIIHGQ